MTCGNLLLWEEIEYGLGVVGIVKRDLDLLNQLLEGNMNGMNEA